jgi:LuxR family maltose regulon positive regulatory protein
MNQANVSQYWEQSISVGLPQIALTKTVPPSTNRVRVERGRLLKALENSAARRLILIRAPAGYGKTTLAVDWCEQLRQSGAVVAWLSLDEDDDEPSVFAYHIAKTIHRAAPDLGQAAIDLLMETKLIDSKNVLSAAINAVAESDSEVYLFLDDYHAVTDPRSHELTEFLLRYAPSNFHLVVMSRTELPFSISKLRLADEVSELEVASLRFTLAETARFLGTELPSTLGPAEISKLHAATEGWPAALQLARISVRNSTDPSKTVSSFSGASQKISTFLEDTLSTQADEIVNFLLQTAILDRLHGALCQAVTGNPRSTELLKALNHEQLLLATIDEENGWYRYHNLMSDFLMDRLQSRMADQIPELHRRAYKWYAAHEMWNLAVQHAIAAKDFEQALAYVEQCAMSLVIKGDLLTLLAWERQLPAELMRGQALVKLALAWGMALVTRLKEADALLTQVEEIAQADQASELWWKCCSARAAWYGLSDDSAQGFKIATDARQYRSYNAFDLNNIGNLLRYGHLKAGRWDEFYAAPKPEKEAAEATYVLAENYRLYLHAMAATQKLEFDEALRLASDARALAEKYVGAKSVAAAMATVFLALPRYERGDVSGAEIAVLDDLNIIETTGFHESFLSAFVVLVRAAICRGDKELARVLLNRAERVAAGRGWDRVVSALVVERVRLCEPKIHDVQAAADQLHALCGKHPAPERSSWTDIHINAAIVDGFLARAESRPEDALRSLAWAYDELLATDNRYGALRAGLDLARVAFVSGKRIRAFEVLKQVLDWAAKSGSVSFVGERPREFRDLLTAAQKDSGVNSEHRAFLERLLRADDPQSGPAGSHGGTRAQKPVLTERERSIVEFIAEGQSNKQIARTLGVTPETVKTHVKRVFIKLSAETRAQAVVRAQSLGVLRRVQAN